MLSQTDLERERYESRRKAILDENTKLRSARREGIKEGIAKGQQIGVIHLCERMLHRQETPTEQLAELSLAELSRLADELQASLLPK